MPSGWPGPFDHPIDESKSKFENYFLTPQSWITDPAGSALKKVFGVGKKEDAPDWIIGPDGNIYPGKKSGQYVGIPKTDVPGAYVGSTKAYRGAADEQRIFEDLFPRFASTVAGQIIPQEQAKLAASQVTSPQFAKLMTDLYAQYGPQLNKIGTDISLQNALAQAGNDLSVLQGPGGKLIQELVNQDKVANPEFYASRELAAKRLADLMQSIDLTGGLSPTEQREIGQGLALEGSRRGTYNAPSMQETVGNAMRYGEAGRARQVENQDQLMKAIAASTAFIPAARSGFDVAQIGLGRPSTSNTGESKFTGVATPGNEAQSLGQGMFGNINSLTQAAMQNNLSRDLASKDWLDKFGQFTQGLGPLAGLIGGAMCWVAREVYGENNIKWRIFRQWIVSGRAPKWLVKLYATYGARFALFIHNKPMLKRLIRRFMDNVIERNYTYARNS